MAQSLVKLTLESNQYEKNLRQAKRSWDEFAKGIGLNMSKFTAMAAAIGATSTALKVAKDAFFANEKNVDEWGRTVQAAGSLYDGFLKSLNNGDISGYLNNIGRITQAARDAYDALDELDTFNAFNQINTQRTRREYTEMYAGYRTGEASKQQVMTSANAYKNELRERAKLEQQVYEAAIAEAAAKANVPRGNLEQILGGTYGDYNKLKSMPMTGTRRKPIPGLTPTYIDVAAPANDTERMAEALRQLTDDELKKLQALGAQAERTGEEIAQIDKQLARVLGGGQTSGKSAGGSGRSTTKATSQEMTEEQQNQQKINAYIQEYISLRQQAGTTDNTERLAQLQQEISLLKQRNEQLSLYKEQAQGILLPQNTDLSNIHESLTPQNTETTQVQSLNFSGWNPTSDMDFKNMLDEFGDKIAKAQEDFIRSNQDGEKKMPQGLKQLNKINEGFGEVTGGVSSIANGIEQLGITMPEGLQKTISAMQAISMILTGISTIVIAILAIQSAKATPIIGWLLHGGGTNAGGRVVKAASGYTVPGNYGYDAVPAMLTSGETVLNKAQTNTLASMLREGGGNNLQLSATISGEQIRLALNNNGRRTGRGEYVTTNFQ